MFSGSSPDNADQQLSNKTASQGQASQDSSDSSFACLMLYYFAYTQISLEVPFSFARFFTIAKLHQFY